jgi:mitogen-activated protein kinase kinase 1
LSSASTHDDGADVVASFGISLRRMLSVSSNLPTLKRSSSDSNMNGKRNIKFSEIQKSRAIGRGVTASVWLCQDATRSNSNIAVKCIPLVRKSERSASLVVEELVRCFGIEHPALIRCHNVFFSDNAFHLVMEFMDGGSLLQALKRNMELGVTIPPTALGCVAQSVLSALDFLHEELHVIHRDVKPANILLSKCGKAKLADLGIATSPSSSNYLTNEWAGTTTYMSPERLRGDDYSFSADIWSLGLTLVEAALGRYPLVPYTTPDMKRKKLDFWDLLEIVDGPCPARVLNRNQEWDALFPLATACLAKNPDQRPRASTLLSGVNSGRSFQDVAIRGARFLAHADSRALRIWVSHESLVSDDCSHPKLGEKSDEDDDDLSCRTSDGWL